MSRVMSTEDAVMCLTHGLFAIPCWKVQRHSWIFEIVQPDPNNLVFVLEEFVNHGCVVGFILFWYGWGPLISVPECLDALQNFILHLKLVEIGLKWVEGRNACDAFFGARKP